MIKNNVPPDLAFGLDATTRQAWSILFSQMEGAVFDWGSWSFRDRS